MSGTPGLIVIKLGGSVIFSKDVHHWIDAIANLSRPLMLVTGGGKIADAVRDMQTQAALEDTAAHQIAVYAMNMTAMAITSKHPKFILSDDENEMFDIMQKNRIPIWYPFRMVNEADSIEQNWDVTSDSLALFLAWHLSVGRGKPPANLFLTKSVAMKNMPHPAKTLAKKGIVDNAFPRYLGDYPVPAFILCPGEWQELENCVDGACRRSIRP